jgi:hypothetical protein
MCEPARRPEAPSGRPSRGGGLLTAIYLPPDEYEAFDGHPGHFDGQSKSGKSHYVFVDSFYITQGERAGLWRSEYVWWFFNDGLWYRHVNLYLGKKKKGKDFYAKGTYGKPYQAGWMDRKGRQWPYEHPNQKAVV